MDPLIVKMTYGQAQEIATALHWYSDMERGIDGTRALLYEVYAVEFDRVLAERAANG